jgi:hypothetical protein
MPHKTASFHFFGTLSELLPAGKRHGAFALAFQGEQSVKHLFESCGVPHTEVGEITANGVAYVFQRRQGGLDNWGQVKNPARFGCRLWRLLWLFGLRLGG